MEGELAVNSRLDRATPILDGDILGPESIAIRGNELYTGVIGGNVIKYANGKSEVVAKFGKECGKSSRFGWMRLKKDVALTNDSEFRDCGSD